ncbi:MAG: gliding motility-associated C-terminal domain-containing protein [Bacteroidales bacterium]|nr:gliding motility-associated C-terminal domain-containing protein [Bacteroidales bacterium]
MNWFKYILATLLAATFTQVITAQTDIPDSPIFTSASITPESEPTTVVLKWSPSDSLDVNGYIIYQIIGGITEAIDTVYGRLTTNYSYTLSNIITKSEKYRLAAFDTQNYKSRITDPHTTMFLNIEFDKCNTHVELEWSSYEGWPNGVKSFNIYRRTELGTYIIIKNLSADKLSYIDVSVDANQTYYYYIEAISNSNTKATSNSVKLLTNAFIAPQYMSAQDASVDGNNIVTTFILDNSGEVLEYRVQRADSANGSYRTIQSYPNTEQTKIRHIDHDVNANEYRYYYRLVAINPCGVVSAYSNIASNILLNVITDENLTHNISWTDYYAWPNGVNDFKVYRVFNDTKSEIAVNTASDLDYSYNIEWYVDYCHERKITMTNKFCYYVEAYENEGAGSIGSQGVSKSNIACVNHYPVIWIPTAFNATSLNAENREFKPILSFVESESYEFAVYDKWGQKIFSTNETYEGWNGIIDHTRLAPSQYYIYYITYFDHQGAEQIKTGTFFLFAE